MRLAIAVAALTLALAAPAAAEDPMPSRDPMPTPVKLASSSEIFKSVLTADGKLLVTGGTQQVTQSALTLWDVDAGKIVRTGKLQSPGRVSALALGADGKTLLAYLDTRFVEVLSFPELAPQAVIDVRKSNQHYYRVGAFSPDGAFLALGDKDGEIALWSMAERALVKSWKGHDKGVTHLAFATDGATLASGGDEDTVYLWSVPKGKELREIDDLEGATIGLAFSPDGTLLAIGSRVKGFGGQVRVWSVPRKRFAAQKQCMVMFPVVRFAYSPDGKRLAYSCSTFMEKGTSLVRVLDIEKEKLAATLHYEIMTQDVLYLPDGARLLTVQKREFNSRERSEMNQSVAAWTIEPPRFLHYLHDPAAKP